MLKSDITHNVCSDRDYSCEESGCNDEGICRCGVIDRVTLSTNLYDFVYLYEGPEGIEKALWYWFYKLMSRKHGECQFEAHGSYYGEELTSASYGEAFSTAMSKFEDLSVNDKIYYLLTQENGFVLPEVLKVKEWELKPVFLSAISPLQNDKVDQNFITNLSWHVLGLSKKTNKPDPKEFSYMAMLCLPDPLTKEKTFKIVDGRHRLTLFSQMGFKYVFVICPKGFDKII